MFGKLTFKPKLWPRCMCHKAKLTWNTAAVGLKVSSDNSGKRHNKMYISNFNLIYIGGIV